MRHMIPGLRFETVADAGVAAGGGGSDDGGDPGDGTTVDETAPGTEHQIDPQRVPPPEETTGGFDYNAPEFQSAVEQAAQARIDAFLAEQNQPPEDTTDPYAGLDNIDFFADDAGQQLAGWLRDHDQKLLNQAMAPVAPIMQEHEEATLRAWSDSEFTRLEGTLGKFDPTARGLILQATNAAAADALNQGQRPDPAQLLQSTATQLHQLLKAEREGADARYRAGLEGDTGGTGVEPPVNGAGAIRTEPVALTARQVTQNFLARG